MNKNIVLIGMRGSGKTTVAKLLAEKLGKEYLELDELLVQRVGMGVAEIVETCGWDYFREQESLIAKEASKDIGKIISTGGGVVTRAENIKALKKHGFVVYLRAPVAVLFDRIGDDPNRPALTEKKTRREEMEALLAEREKLYMGAADVVVDTGGISVDEVVEEILGELKGFGV